MTTGELRGYVTSIRQIAKEFKGRLSILCGLECEYFPEYLPYLRELLETDDPAKRIDYAILGHHYDSNEMHGMYYGACTTLKDAARYANQIIAAMQTNIFAYVAHPDIFLRQFTAFSDELASISRDICQASKAFGVPLEFNLYGVRKKATPIKPYGLGYPDNNFWKIAAETGSPAIIGIDAHEPYHIADAELFTLAEMYLELLGIHRVQKLNL
ncbi:histidinol-phosphatase [Clostridia bacterium]|nr:histidinol-phosphatase [Clostridia bacterium]